MLCFVCFQKKDDEKSKDDDEEEVRSNRSVRSQCCCPSAYVTGDVFILQEDDRKSTVSSRRSRDRDDQRESRRRRDRDRDRENKVVEKTVTRDRQLLLAFSYFDQSHTGYLLDKDLEELLHTLGLHLSRSQVRIT